MKADKKYLTDKIDDIILNGITGSEEYDLTSENIVKLIWPYFQYYEDRNKDLIDILKKEINCKCELGFNKGIRKAIELLKNKVK